IERHRPKNPCAPLMPCGGWLDFVSGWPDPPAKDVSMRRLLLFAICPLVAACSDFAADMQTADTGCAAAGDAAPRARCYQAAEREVWAKEAPATLRDFDTYSSRRLQLAEALDAGAMTREEYAAQ